MLTLSGVTVRYGARPALDDVSLELKQGVTGLLGLNGAGKSSLLHVASGVLRPSSGAARIDELDPYAATSRRAALGKIALVPQEFEFPRHLRLGEFMHYMAFLRGVPRSRRSAAVENAVAAVGLSDRCGDRLRALSGGMLRRALVAQAVLADPEVLLFDESTSGLDPEQRAQLRELVARLSISRCCVFASHIVEDIDFLADRVVVLHQGRIVHDGPRGALVEQHGSSRAADEQRGSALERAFLSAIEEARR